MWNVNGITMMPAKQCQPISVWTWIHTYRTLIKHPHWLNPRLKVPIQWALLVCRLYWSWWMADPSVESVHRYTIVSFCCSCGFYTRFYLIFCCFLVFNSVAFSNADFHKNRFRCFYSHMDLSVSVRVCMRGWVSVCRRRRRFVCELRFTRDTEFSWKFVAFVYSTLFFTQHPHVQFSFVVFFFSSFFFSLS